MREILYFLFGVLILGSCSVNNFNEHSETIKLTANKESRRIVLFNDFVHMSFSLKDVEHELNEKGTSSNICINIDSLYLPINNLLIKNEKQEILLPIIQTLLYKGKVDVYDVLNDEIVKEIILLHYKGLSGEQEIYRIASSSNIYTNVISIGE